MIFDSGIVCYLGIVIFAERFDGHIPLIDVTFGKTFRLLFVSLVGLIGMTLVSFYGFMVYLELSDDDQAVYIGYVFCIVLH